MHRVILDLETVTPCFLGGAERQEAAEWRAASVRGQLRWWLRAMANAEWTLTGVRTAEDTLFGSTERSSLIRVRTHGSPEVTAAGGLCGYGGRGFDAKELAAAWGDKSDDTVKRLALRQTAFSNPILYLGYGCILWDKDRRKPVFEHGRIEASQKVSMELQWRRTLTEPETELLRKTLWGWLNLGGIGARSRRGFGSLRCIGVQGDGLGDLAGFAPSSNQELRAQAQALLPPRTKQKKGEPAPPLPEWSRLSGSTRIYLGRRKHRDWENAMAEVGGWLIAYRRRYGSSHHVHPSVKPPLEARDYEWAAREGQAKGEGIPDRAGFGLPLPFGDQAETVTWGSPKQDGRRASPLLIRIAKLGERDYVPVLTHLPASLVPEGEQLFLKDRPETGASPNARQESIVRWFLSDLASASKDLIQEVRS